MIKKQKEEEKAKKKAAERDSRAKKRAPRSTNNLMWTNDLQMHLHQGLVQEPNVRNLCVVTVTVILTSTNVVCAFEDDERDKSGLEWVDCACSRWLHEECIEYDLSVNSRGQELLCPF